MANEEDEEKLVARIDDSHHHPDDMKLQQQLMNDCFTYFLSLDSKEHLFCVKNRATIVVYLLVVLASFNDNNVLTEIQQRSRQSLDSCTNCIFGFHHVRASLREKFIIERKVSYKNTEVIMKRLADTDSKYLSERIRSSIDIPGNLSDIVSNTLLECMVYPRLLRSSDDLRSYIDQSFGLIDEVQEKYLSKVLPVYSGLLYCLFEGTEKQRTWAVSALPYAKTVTYTVKEMSPLIMEEYEVHLFKIQDPEYYTDDRAARFWASLIPIMRFCDDEVISTKLEEPVTSAAYRSMVSFNVFPLTRIFINQSLSYLYTPLPFLLRALSVFLERLGDHFFTLIKPHSYLTFFDIAFQNPAYLKTLAVLPQDDTSLEDSYCDSVLIPLYRDMFKWITSTYKFLTDSQKVQFSCAIFNFMMDHVNDANYGDSFGYFALNIVATQLNLQNELFSHSLTFELLNDSRVRALVDKKCIVIFDLIKNPVLSSHATELIQHSLQYDIAVMAQIGYGLSKGDTSATPLSYPALWNLLQTKLTGQHSVLAATVLTSFSSVVSVHSEEILYLKTKLANSPHFSDEKLHELVALCSKHNKAVIQWVATVEQILNRIAEYLGNSNMQNLLKNADSAKGVWSCIMSPEEKVYLSGIAFLYEAFDVDGRYEAFKSCLQLDMTTSVESMNLALQGLTNLQLFSASKRGVRILMDYTRCLIDPIHGLLATTDVRMQSKSMLANFWQTNWSFFRMVYKSIFVWSVNYEKLKANLQNETRSQRITSDLLEFTRDTLDLSQTTFDGYQIMVTALTFDGIKDVQLIDIKESLFQPVIGALKEIMMWLRLSDSALLVLCVNLILGILNLAVELHAEVPDDDIIVLTKLCAKAKKFNNKLNDEQKGELLLRARQINDGLVQEVLDSVEDQKRETSARPAIRRASGSTPKMPEIEKPKKEPSPPKRMSALEEAAARLGEHRKGFFPTSTRGPAPARPSGYNKKIEAAVESDSSDSDDSDGAQLFTKDQVAEKLKKSKSALSSLHYNRPTSISVKKAKKRESLIRRKKAEELMRLRLNVDLSPFYHHILSWSYDKSGDFPVDSEIGHYMTVKDEFNSPEDYQQTFEPLLLLECWQSIQRAKEIGGEKPFRLTVASRSATDTFFDVFVSIDKNLITGNKRVVGESDLVVLMYIDKLPSSERPIQNRHVQSRKSACFARVRNIKIVNGKLADLTLRVSTTTPMLKYISPSTELVAMRVMQMTTVEREYSSLKGLPYYDLCDQIIHAVPTPPEQLDSRHIEDMKRAYHVNDSQAVAIAGTVHNDGFALIQGPPGTGKTKTILGIVGYVLTSSSTNEAHAIQVPGVKSAPAPKKDNKRILICAPSNAAVDELVIRLKQGIKNYRGATFRPKIVRLGRSDAVNSEVKDITLEELVDRQLSDASTVDDSDIRAAHKKCLEQRDKLRSKLDSGDLSEEDIAATELELQKVVQQRRDLGRQLDQAREQRSISHRNREIERRSLQFKILNDAQVVCATLSSSANEILAGMSMTFDTVVIDEAAQCIELSAIIPLRYGCKKCVMVGDPNQLPPTVLSQKAAAYKYEQSLFVRMQNNHKESVYLLNVQYRMHPDISSFPSKEFYDSQLLNGPNMADLNAKPWHKVGKYAPYMFFDVHGSESQNERTKSVFNYTEASIALEIVESLLARFPDINWSGNIGVISPYKEQVRLLQKLFVDRFGSIITKQIDFNTVDGFQGQEKEVILFSCVRAENHVGIGFLADIRRMNVALTRARASLWVLGSRNALIANRNWKHLVDDAYERKLVTQAFRGFMHDDKVVELHEDDKELNSEKAKSHEELSAKKAGSNEPCRPNIPSKPTHSKSSYKSTTKSSSKSTKLAPKKSGKLPPMKRPASGTKSRSYTEAPPTSDMFQLTKKRAKLPPGKHGKLPPRPKHK